MKKITLLIISFYFLTNFSFGQIAPDFTATDIFGNQHSLYEDYLNQGKSVIIDFSTTWCGPCWAFHKDRVLNDINEIFGPEGSDEVAILFIESDTSTSIGDLYGTDSLTIGNWVEGTTYPIIDENGMAISEMYNVQAFPTVFLICSDGSIFGDIYELSGFNLDFIKTFEYIYNCIPGSGLNNEARLVYNKGEVKSCYSINHNVYLQNFGNQVLENIPIKVYRNNELYRELTYNGQIEPNKLATIELNDLVLDLNNEITEFKVVLPDDDNNENNTLTFEASQDVPLTTNKITIRWVLDMFSEEDNTNFIITNSEGDTVYSSGTLSNNVLYEETITLEELGCYKIVLIDGLGDGVYGEFFAFDSNNDTIYYSPEISPFSVFRIPFNSIHPYGIENEISNSAFNVSLSPNYTKNYSSLIIDSEFALNKVDISVVNMLGNVVSKIHSGNINIGKNGFNIDLTNLPPAQYFVRISSKYGVKIEKIIKY